VNDDFDNSRWTEFTLLVSEILQQVHRSAYPRNEDFYRFNKTLKITFQNPVLRIRKMLSDSDSVFFGFYFGSNKNFRIRRIRNATDTRPPFNTGYRVPIISTTILSHEYPTNQKLSCQRKMVNTFYQGCGSKLTLHGSGSRSGSTNSLNSDPQQTILFKN
jgi:hypothetical protein